MGRRKSRKAERRQAARGGAPEAKPADPPLFLGRTYEQLFGDDAGDDWGGPRSLSPLPRAAATCGNCHEFVEDAEGGRGTCLHPGSGVLAPWTDTEACPFFEGRRVRAMDPRRERW
ncbi:MAG: hypothetical protein IT303_20035 [Dehalococcoidia bacterium]|nr:hypothetical protein [Dehalococcoidia bacterium]